MSLRKKKKIKSHNENKKRIQLVKNCPLERGDRKKKVHLKQNNFLLVKEISL